MGALPDDVLYDTFFWDIPHSRSYFKTLKKNCAELDVSHWDPNFKWLLMIVFHLMSFIVFLMNLETPSAID